MSGLGHSWDYQGELEREEKEEGKGKRKEKRKEERVTGRPEREGRRRWRGGRKREGSFLIVYECLLEVK